jgi:hypothetical protein
MRARAPLTIVPLEDRAVPASCGVECVGPALDDGYDAPLVGPESTDKAVPGPSEADGYPGPDFLGPDDPYSRVWW